MTTEQKALSEKPLASKVFVHNDGCESILIDNGSGYLCPTCNSFPPIKDVAIAFICPKDKTELNREGECPECKVVYKKIYKHNPHSRSD